MDTLSVAEAHALEATKLPSCAINLSETKRAVAHILSTFGRSLIFAEYTVHDISHADEILRALNWLIPKETQAVLSKAEWLMLVLSAYFHDMGLVVTESEFSERDKSGFKIFCDERLFSGPGAADYKAKGESLPPDRQERFLYEEFVRANHGKRVRAWIEGKIDTSLGISTSLVEEIDRLLSGLDRDFRKDLAMVCESHNLDDI